ncbi:hypothetical protein BOX15_Mlig021918g1 [Macrostomum lignano]|uniref:Uncharacterized protein n=2 Tax=Macrostomum lignano TaxID=282301 RepID=A0A267H8M9_9PLAT|nr:hypothetical protein BOX15_Mlig021918g1 [Macrostomum lignano]
MSRPTLDDALQAARSGDAKTLCEYLDAGGDSNLCDGSGQLNLLHLAAMGGHLAAVAELICRSDCRINEPSGRNGDTALIMSVKNGHEAVSKHLLLQGNCDLNLRNRAGFTALMKAAKRGATSLALLLLQHGAELEVASQRGGHTALTLAVSNKRPKTVDQLLDFGASLTHRTASGKTAEDIAYDQRSSAEPGERSKCDRIYRALLDEREHREEVKRDTGLSNDVLNGQYKVIEIIGKGTFGCAFVAQNLRCQDAKAVVKVMRPQPNRRTIEIQRDGIHEAKIMLMADHPQVVRIMQYLKVEKNFCIVMEFCEFGDLDAWINGLDRKHKKFPVDTVIRWFLQLLLGLDYLHSNKIIHRDIKPKNIFLKRHATAKIGDFGFARRLLGEADYASTVAGTLMYMCPEIMSNLNGTLTATVDVPVEGYDSKCDVWSLGCTLFEMSTMRLPFDPNKLKEQVCGDSPLPRLPKEYPIELDTLLTSMLARERKKRASCSQLLDSQLARDRLQDMKVNGCADDLRFLQSNAHLVKHCAGYHLEEDRNSYEDTLTPQAGGCMHRLMEAVDSVLKNRQPPAISPNYNLQDDSISDTVPDSIIEALAERVKWSGFPLEQVYRRSVVNLGSDVPPEERRKDYARFTDDMEACEQLETLVVCEMTRQ